MGLLLVLLAIGAAYGTQRHRVALLSASVLLVLGLEVVFGLAGTVLTSFRADPVADAALSVARGNETPLEVERLEAHSDQRFAALALASRSRRFGQNEETRRRYEELLEEDPRDEVLLTNMGNLLYADGDHDGAIAFYERAGALTNSATLWFNLSQAYARAFRMEELETALHRGQAIDAAKVEELSNRGDTEFVADLPLPIRALRERMIRRADDGALSTELVGVIAPGWLGRSWLHLAGAFAAALAVGVALGGTWEHSSSCGRCGRRICVRCDDQIWNADLCDGCHHLFHRPQGTDPKLRTARINALRAREARLEKLWLAVSVLVPGVSGLRARRPDLAFIGILLFGWAAAIWIWRDGVVPDPLALGGIGPMALLLSGLAAAFAYLLVLLSGLIMQRNL
jgi:tetratricopeptide (TPR) repeat protein